jgi:4-amino-4-deoxy-L-arabinose transferase-like glycosyltransferase
MSSAGSWIELTAVSLAVPLLALVPGGLFAARLSSLEPEERAAVAGGLGTGLLGAAAFVAHLAGGRPVWVDAAIWIAAVLGGVVALALARGRRGALTWRLLGLWALFYAVVLGFQGMSAVYAGGNWYADWWEHYSISQVYAGTEGNHFTVWFGYYTLASRTPLFNLGAAFALAAFGDRFWVYQVYSTFVSSLFVLAMYLVVDDLWGRRAALVCAVFVFFDAWLVHDAMFTWSKMIAAYFALMSLHFYLRFRARTDPATFYLCALMGALAVMCHQSAAYFLIALPAAHWLLRPRPPLSRRQVGLGVAIVLVVMAPWHWWVSDLYTVGGAVHANPVLSTGQPTLARFLHGGAENAVTSLVPVPLVDYLLRGRLAEEKVVFRLSEFYLNPLAGALTVSLMAALLFTVRRPLAPPLRRGFYQLRGPLVSLGFGALVLVALIVGRPRYAFEWLGPGPFVWAFGAGLIALGLVTWRRRPRPAEWPSGDALHLTVALFVLAGYFGGLLAHPGGEVDGVATNAMVSSVILVIACALRRAALLPRWGQKLLAAGVVLESAILWVLLARLRSGDPPFAFDVNRDLKAQYHLTFMYDLVEGKWWPFALLTLAGQAAALALAGRAAGAADQIRPARMDALQASQSQSPGATALSHTIARDGG